MKNDRAYPCDTLITTNVNGNNEESGKVFTWVKLKLFKLKLFCNLIGQELFGPYLKNQNFGRHGVCARKPITI